MSVLLMIYSRHVSRMGQPVSYTEIEAALEKLKFLQFIGRTYADICTEVLAARVQAASKEGK